LRIIAIIMFNSRLSPHAWGKGVENRSFKRPCCGSWSMPPYHFAMLPIRQFNLLYVVSRFGALTLENGKKWRAQAGTVSKATLF
jgi:hypothetical protein